MFATKNKHNSKECLASINAQFYVLSSSGRNRYWPSFQLLLSHYMLNFNLVKEKGKRMVIVKVIKRQLKVILSPY